MIKLQTWWQDEYGQKQTGSPRERISSLEPLYVTVPGITQGNGPPTVGRLSHFWVCKVKMENQSREPISVGDFMLEVRRSDEVHLLHHIGNDVYGSRGGVPSPEKALEADVVLTDTRPLVTGIMRFIDDSPFDPGLIEIRLLVNGVGYFKGQLKSIDLGQWELD